jgi:hypothetical protein
VNKNLSATATSAVLTGGLVSAFLGPELATLGKDWFNTPFVGSFVLLSGCFAIVYTQTPKKVHFLPILDIT